MPFVFLGWLWAWWCDPSEMMRQRRQRLALEASRHVTRMSRDDGYTPAQWEMTCSCGWQRITYKTADVVRQIMDQHEKQS